MVAHCRPNYFCFVLCIQRDIRMLAKRSALLVVIKQQNNELMCLGRNQEGGVNREAQGIQVRPWRVLTGWYTQKSIFVRMVRNESYDALWHCGGFRFDCRLGGNRPFGRPDHE